MAIRDLFQRESDPEAKRQAERNRRKDQAVAQAAIVDGFIDDLNRPTELEVRPEFRLGVDALDDPCFDAAELLELSDDPSKSIWQMGMTVVARREPDPALVDRLLTLYDAGGPWHQHFVMKALVVHMPLEHSLAGELVFRLIGLDGPYLGFVCKNLAPVLTQRLDKGEQPAFGTLLERLDAPKAAALDAVLKVALETPLQAVAEHLRRDLDTWRSAFVDQDLLRTIGRIWDQRTLTAPPLIDHSQLVVVAQDVLRALSQSPRRSVLVTGEHGVGKSAVVRRVGQELLDDGWIVFEATGADLIAGQKHLGDLEQRFQTLMEQLGGGRKVLWYVPDIQTLAWTGTHEYSRTGVLDLLLPFIESGEVVIVGELPVAAYEQLVQTQPRLATACEVCRVAPLDEAASLELAAAWAAARDPELLPAPVLREAWLLARQYLRDREPPGCLLDFLSQTRKLVAAETDGPVRITHDDLVATLAAMTSLPRQVLDEREKLDPDQLRAFFQERIMGQPEAVGCLVDRIALIKAGLTDPSRPQGVFLFAGPTGTGKTEIAKALARFLFGSEDRLLRYDMSEFQTPDSCERLVGDGKKLDGDHLTLRIRKQPFAVILLDEFEKAHPRVWDLFLQVFDDGRLTEPSGHTADFRHAIIILTSNLGGQTAARAGLGFDQDGRGFQAGAVDRAIEDAFRPEFLNRLDRVVVFRPFSREVMREILDKELRDVQQRRGLRNRDWAVVWEDSALEFLLDRGFSPTLGARPLKRAIERYLLTPLAETIVRGSYPVGDQFLYIQAEGERLHVEFIDPEADDGPPPDGDDPCQIAETSAPADLASIALAPCGDAAEFTALTGHLNRLRQHLDSPEWRQAKSLALSMTALPDFWESPERGAVLGEVEYRERVENGLAAAAGLVERIVTMDRAATRYPRKLVGQAAERLFLIEQACRALETRTPWEAFVLIESKHDPAAEVRGADALVDHLGAMYRRWGQRRKMRVHVLEDRRRGPGRTRSILLAVTGYAAHAILESETGLHVWEEPDPRGSRSSVQHRAQVRVETWPDDVVEDPPALLAVAREIMDRSLPGAPTVVRIYREQPDPLVKDRRHGWRTGRLDRVLDGDFDLLAACARASTGEARS
jgi:ATP-dependent Clp protease ATP-binding subunit ClpC